MFYRVVLSHTLYLPDDPSAVRIVRVTPGWEGNQRSPLVLARLNTVVAVGTTAAVSFPLGSVVIIGSHVMSAVALMSRMISGARTALNH